MAVRDEQNKLPWLFWLPVSFEDGSLDDSMAKKRKISGELILKRSSLKSEL